MTEARAFLQAKPSTPFRSTIAEATPPNSLWQKSHRAASAPFPPTLRWKTSTIPESPAVFAPRFDEKFAALAGARLPPQAAKVKTPKACWAWMFAALFWLCALPAGSTAEESGEHALSGFELLDRVERHYRGVRHYRDHGTIERIGPSGRQPELEVQTRLHYDTFELVLRIGGTWRRIWRQGDKVFEFESTLNQYREARSLTAAIADGLGIDGYETLLVPLALAGSSQPFADVQAVSLEGQAACGPDDALTCRRLLLSRDGGLLETELWIDPGLWIRRIEVTKATPLFSVRKVPRYDLPDRKTSGQSTIRVSLHPEPGPSEPTEGNTPGIAEGDTEKGTEEGTGWLAELPDHAQRVDTWTPPESSKENTPESDLETFTDQITVRLVRFRIYAVDRSGAPLRDLKLDDFEASWGKSPIPVVAVRWVDADEPEQLSPLDRAELKALGVRPPPVGRRVVIFVQSALEAVRKSGHRRLLHRADKILETLGPHDQVAVVSFDSHLKLWLDWSRDRQEIAEALRQTTLGFGSMPRLRHSDEPSALSSHWDARQAKKVASPEKALELTARAMAEVPGEKLMIYLGWGLGRFSREGVRMTSEYGPAVEALEAARTSVFVLDVTDADYHSLEVGLQSVAAATGGAYYRTRLFADQAIRRLGATLSGHYLVTLDGSALTAAQEELPSQTLNLRLLKRKSELLGPPLALE